MCYLCSTAVTQVMDSAAKDPATQPFVPVASRRRVGGEGKIPVCAGARWRVQKIRKLQRAAKGISARIEAIFPHLTCEKFLPTAGRMHCQLPGYSRNSAVVCSGVVHHQTKRSLKQFPPELLGGKIPYWIDDQPWK